MLTKLDGMRWINNEEKWKTWTHARIQSLTYLRKNKFKKYADLKSEKKEREREKKTYTDSVNLRVCEQDSAWNIRHARSSVLTNWNEENIEGKQPSLFTGFAYEMALIRKQNLESCFSFHISIFPLRFSVARLALLFFSSSSSSSILLFISRSLSLHFPNSIHIACDTIWHYIFLDCFAFFSCAIFRSYFSALLGTNHR